MQFITIKGLEELCEGQIAYVDFEGENDKWIIVVFKNGCRFKFKKF
jgi:hypothetical protein